MLIGIVGKPNVGKSTFFKALTLADVAIAPHPFTTIKPNRGIGYVRVPCPCKDFGVKCNPKNSFCLEGNRFAPVELLDVAGLVPGAHEGRGLGNKFLDDLRQADALIHLVDLSGTTDAEGNPTQGYDPAEEIKFLEEEIDRWFFGILKKNRDSVMRRVTLMRGDITAELAQSLSGLGVKREHIMGALRNLGMEKEDLFKDERLFEFASELRKVSKPILVVGNKADMKEAKENLKRLNVLPCSAEVELALKEASRKGLIKYIPGDDDFVVLKGDVDQRRLRALEFMRNFLKENRGSGVQRAINEVVLNLLGAVVVYPVEDENKLTNKEGEVLPDAFVMPRGSRAIDLAYRIHSDLGDNFIKAVDCRSKKVVGRDYVLKNGDVIKIVARA